ncbi:MAG: DsbA family protein [Pseudomonadales bacterium]|nr:DsbA family protein [Pseudomonadales bacterium]
MTPQLQVYIDYKSPYAFIAKDATYQLEEAFGICIDWYPLTLNIGSYLGTAKVNDVGEVVESNRSPRQWLAVRYAYYDARRYAALRGLTLKGPKKIWDSSLVHIGMLWAKGQHHDILKAYTDCVFERFWQRQLDIEDVHVVVDMLRLAGAELSGFEAYLAGAGREQHDDLQENILNKGYFGVPTYVIDDEIYFGRENLPKIRWHLAGSVGPCPDIAYDILLPELADRS